MDKNKIGTFQDKLIPNARMAWSYWIFNFSNTKNHSIWTSEAAILMRAEVCFSQARDKVNIKAVCKSAF